MVQGLAKKRLALQAQKVRVKDCDFQKVSRIQSEFKDRSGLVDLEKRIIWLDLGCHSRPVDVRAVVLNHERAHLMLHDLGIKWDAKTTERFCDLYAVVKAPKSSLSQLELILREILTPVFWPEMIQLAHRRRAKDSREYQTWAAQGEGME